MTTISSTAILRSRNAAAPDKVLSTLLLRYPRCIHAEFMTHRVFSRNAASSRAIPVEKLIKDVIENPFVPVFWGLNQKGMQATVHSPTVEMVIDGGYCMPDSRVTFDAEKEWLRARDKAVEMAHTFAKAGYHKQIVNRLLEPFAHITVLVSGTEWDNFLELRDHEAAEPHIQILAREIRKCLEREEDIQELQPGEWHLPFVNSQREDDGTLSLRLDISDGVIQGTQFLASEEAIKLSVARCASTSYKTVDGFDMTMDRAIELHDKLVSSTPIHASPAEHVAQADNLMDGPGEDGDLYQVWAHEQEHGNFVGFRQYRHML
ncbi:FAD-dependent thymidylate synthase [Sphingopyxis indica]|uniref:FAD-dependent thymidylate synthase n=1 Tax=Sphingopyxis indica TaxID=436663 RepID=UPI0029391BAD|nr:FAD-dependent thymidylate synthase [Sphingopyxis indica]WOF44273.1 FAD-dependent thymidylate synthase [Sphingopyxis indica]